ncbi:hypothetical protein FQN60_015270 [Etheostoma spectabile]|uniref:Uncharacterized protein n=1 Tax=Etheostoma spectabile TaxID=54343 RepID=A0A5J5CPW8_9PERO|nr:hypothetical protein FQN60_015270 [Etheostoma spectabile]
MAKSDGCDYFRRTSLFWIVSVTLGVAYFTVVGCLRYPCFGSSRCVEGVQ